MVKGGDMAGKERHEMKVAVLAGGISDEREISLASGKNAAAALTEAGYGTVEMVDPASRASSLVWKAAITTLLLSPCTALAARTA